MLHDTHGLHHFHRRKRIHQKHEPYPHPDRLKGFMDKFIYAVGLFGPIMTLPQLLKIWVNKTAAGVSAISWGAYLICACFWIVYGVMHKEKPIIVMNVAWVVLDGAIIVGAIVYA